jgi:MraZ protein
VTRKTQIGLLTAACVLCCAGVFLGARLSSRSHAASEAPAMTIEPPEPPTPVLTESGLCETATDAKDKPTIVAAVETPPEAPPRTPGTDVPGSSGAADPVERTIGQKTHVPIPEIKVEDTLPPVPPDADGAKLAVKPMTPADLVPVDADQTAKDDKVDLAPPPTPAAGTPDGSPKPPAPTRELSAPPVPMSKDVTEKTSPLPKSAPVDPPPPAVKPSTPEPPVATPPAGIDPLLENPKIARPDPAPPPAARIVPVSPTTPDSAKATPVLKKPADKARTLPWTGTHSCRMDGDHGVTLPKAVREQMGEQEVLFVTLGTDHSVWVTTAAGLEKLAERLEKTTDVEDESKVTRRRYFAQTERVAVDKAGRFILPAALTEAAGLKQDAVIIGVGDHLELWDAQRWQKVSETRETSAADSHEEL